MNHIKQRLLRIALAITLTVGSVLTCFSCAADDGKIDVRLGCFPNITHSQALYGMASKSFETALGDTCDVTWHTFNAGPSEMEAIFAGEIDIAYIGPVPAINGYAKSSGDVVVIAGATDAGGILVTRSDLILSGVSDLAGKKVAVPQFGNTQDLLLRAVLHDAGLADTTNGGNVEIIQSENPNTKLLLDNGDVDAAFVPEPWGSRLVKETGANVLLEYDEIFGNGKYTSAVVVVRTEFLDAHPDIVKAFLQEHVRLTEYINENKEEASNIINSQIKTLTQNELPADILEAAYGRLTITCDPESASLEKFIGTYRELGFIDDTIDFSSFIQLDPLNQVLTAQSLPQIQG